MKRTILMMAFVVGSGCAALNESEPCEERTQCGGDGCNARFEQPLSADESCWEERQKVSCSSAESVGQAGVYARDPSGRCWKFREYTVPRDWQPDEKCEFLVPDCE